MNVWVNHLLTYSQEIKSIQFKLKECQQQISALPKVHTVLHIYSQEEHTFKLGSESSITTISCQRQN